jgi:hypothetical protein
MFPASALDYSALYWLRTVAPDEASMSLPETIQHIYQELALRYERQHEQRLRDVFYLLAADVAFASGRGDEAERIRQRMLEANPNSLVRPFPSFAAALQSLDIQDYLADLRRQYPPEEAEKLLIKVRANPLGQRSEPQRAPSLKDAQEATPPTARTVNMPPAANVPPRKKSPYEQSASPPPAEESAWGASVTVFWFFLLALCGLGLAIWTLARPFWDPA